MKLATTTADLRGYSDKASELVGFFDGTGFKYLDFNFYRSIYPGSPLLDERWEGWIEDAGKAAAVRGVQFCQAHAPDGNPFSSNEDREVYLKATIRTLEACAILGIPQIVIHSKDIGGYPSRDYHARNLEQNRRFFCQLFPIMEKTGVKLLFENSCDRHAPTKEQSTRHFPSTAAELLDLVEFMDHPLVDVCWDTGHANVQGVDQYQSLVELGSRLSGVHINDNYGDMDSHVAPFQGTTNLDSIMQALVDMDYKGYFTFESSNILRDGSVWPNFRREWHYRNEKATRLMNVPFALKHQAVALLYQIGKHILMEYDCFEE